MSPHRQQEEDRRIIEASGFFDAGFYLEHNADVAAAKVHPLEHYLQFGAREGRNPSAAFDSLWYLSQYDDVAKAGLNPLAHYLRHGLAEGRLPTAPKTSNHIKNALTSSTNASTPTVVENAGSETGTPEIFTSRFCPITPEATIREHKFAKVAGPKKVVSIIYNYFDKRQTVLKSINSVAQQTWNRCRRQDIEVILVDDGSPSPDIAADLPEDVLYLWQRKTRYGISRAKNTAARLANGDYLVFLDPDIMVCPSFVDSILERFDQYGDRLIQTGYIWDYHFEGCVDPRTEFGVWERPNRPTRRFYQVAGGNLAIARRVFFETPGFDEDLIYGGVEDLLFGYHLSKLAGTAVMFNRSMETWHIPHPPGGAHADPGRTWEIIKLKWPEFYREYFDWGLR